MGPRDEADVSRILDAVGRGDDQAAQTLFAIVYDELRRLAQVRLGQVRGQSIQATELVHEAYMRLVGAPEAQWANQAHFFAAAARAMRFILVDRLRRSGRLKRGGGRRREPLADGMLVIEDPTIDLLALDEALNKLDAQDPQKANVVMLRYFAGLTGDEAAAALGVSAATVDRQWRFARAWLRREMEGAGGT